MYCVIGNIKFTVAGMDRAASKSSLRPMPVREAATYARHVDNALHRRAFGTWPLALRATGIVVLITVVIGGLTSPAQQYLPDAIRSLANAAGPWFVVVLVAVRLARSPLVLSILLGIAGFLILTLSYGVVSELRGFPWAFVNIWTIVAIPAGIAVGIASTWLRSHRRLLIGLGAAVPAFVLIAEGIYGLTFVLATTGPFVWVLELVGAVAWLAWVWARRLKHRETPVVVVPEAQERPQVASREG
jgi:Family of unknown function (DUF6518)